MRTEHRLVGLDLARFLAFSGMVLVNFSIVMGDGSGSFAAQWFLDFLSGKAAASFVVLAGLGFGLSARRALDQKFYLRASKRILFLLVLGLLNALIFPADILHYYAFYFLCGLFLLRFQASVWLWLAGLLPFLFIGLVLTFNYDAGWDWETLDYTGFWSIEGFLRNLIFNGWHPIIPWLSFFLVGMFLSRLDLKSSTIARRLVFLGFCGLVLSPILSAMATGVLSADDALLFGTSPIPPGPLFIATGCGAALIVIGLCLRIQSRMGAVTKALANSGRQALTLYIAHIVLGMGLAEALGWVEAHSADFAIVYALGFIFICVIYAKVWTRMVGSKLGAGPFEWVMRRVAG